jgi:hypothetical protein
MMTNVWHPKKWKRDSTKKKLAAKLKGLASKDPPRHVHVPLFSKENKNYAAETTALAQVGGKMAEVEEEFTKV